MPLFRTTPGKSIGNSIRRMLSSRGGLSPLQEMQADNAAAQTAHRLSLVDKVRAEVDAMKNADAARSNPGLQTEYAAHSAGIDLPDAERLRKAIIGVRERPPIENDDEGNRMPDVTFARPENLKPGAEGVFRSALASTIANRIATGKTNATQLAQAGDRINETRLTQDAALEPDTTKANRIIAAVAGKLREPFKVGPQGQVLNEETGDVNEKTGVTTAGIGLTKARTGTEGAKQGELDTRSSKNTALSELARERAGAVKRGEANKGGARVTPQQVERWASEVARKEWDTIPPRERKGMNYQQHLEKVRERFKSTSISAGAKEEVGEAHAAIAKGADAAKVAKRFKERMGFSMPEYVKPAAAGGDNDDED